MTRWLVYALVWLTTTIAGLMLICSLCVIGLSTWFVINFVF